MTNLIKLRTCTFFLYYYFLCALFFYLGYSYRIFSSCRRIVYKKKISGKRTLPLFSFSWWFSVSRHSKEIKIKIKTPGQNPSIDKVQNLGNERRYIYKDPRQDSGQKNISYTRYPKKCFTQIYRELYGDAMLVLTWMSSNMADGNQQKHLLPSFATKEWIYSSKNS